jgi:hypothetical protein
MRSDVLQVRGRKLAALLMTYPQLIGVDVGAGTGQSSGGTEFYHQIVSPDLVGPPQLGDLRVVLSRRPPVHLVDHGGVGHMANSSLPSRASMVFLIAFTYRSS